MSCSTSTHRLLVAALLNLGAGCSRVPPFREYDGCEQAQFEQAPLLVLGVTEGDEAVGRPVPSRHNPNYPMQLHRANLHVEKVFWGTLAERTIPVYYFAFAGGYDGPRVMSLAGEPERRVLWLLKDHGVYRADCDGANTAGSIMSGAHTRYKPEPGESTDQILIDLRSTRGDGDVDDHQFAKGLIYGPAPLQEYVIDKLSNLALTESSEVKYAACQLLWANSLDDPDHRLRQKAQDLVHVARCTCAFDSSGQIACH